MDDLFLMLCGLGGLCGLLAVLGWVADTLGRHLPGGYPNPRRRRHG